MDAIELYKRGRPKKYSEDKPRRGLSLRCTNKDWDAMKEQLPSNLEERFNYIFKWSGHFS